MGTPSRIQSRSQSDDIESVEQNLRSLREQMEQMDDDTDNETSVNVFNSDNESSIGTNEKNISKSFEKELEQGVPTEDVNPIATSPLQNDNNSDDGRMSALNPIATSPLQNDNNS